MKHRNKIEYGDEGFYVMRLQLMLNTILGTYITQDGKFGKQTADLVHQFQRTNGLKTNLRLMYGDLQMISRIARERFLVALDAGHGGYDKIAQKYTSAPSKMMFHEGMEFHDGGWFYEGVENRIIADEVYERLKQEGVNVVKTYDDVEDTSLTARTNLISSYVQKGYFGLMASVHSNAISLDYSKQKLEDTQGFCVYTSKGSTMSDEVAEKHFDLTEEMFPEWRMRFDIVDGDHDYEADFHMLLLVEKLHGRFVAFLQEFGFHTSSVDTNFIISQREKRIQILTETILWYRDKILTW